MYLKSKVNIYFNSLGMYILNIVLIGPDMDVDVPDASLSESEKGLYTHG